MAMIRKRVVLNEVLRTTETQPAVARPFGAEIELFEGANIDINSIKEMLESQGQIKRASITLRLPSELVVEIHERMPVLRAQAQIAPDMVKTLFISDDGVIYEGTNCPQNITQALPYVDGVNIRRQGDGYENLVGIEPVIRLLNLAKRDYPALYEDWCIVSLRRYQVSDASASLIDISSRSTGKLVFAVGNFEDQLRRLAIVLSNGAAADQRPIVGIDMSVTGQVVVDYEGAATDKSKQLYDLNAKP